MLRATLAWRREYLPKVAATREALPENVQAELAKNKLFWRGHDVDGRQLHAGECYEAYREATAEKCVVCDSAILGSYFRFDDGRVCGEGDCQAKYQEAHADGCVMCHTAITGSYYPVQFTKGEKAGEDAKVCAGAPAGGGCACLDSWNALEGDKCLVCKEPILAGFYPVDDGKVCDGEGCIDKYTQR